MGDFVIEEVKSGIIEDNQGIIDLEVFFNLDTIIFSLNKNAVEYEDKTPLLASVFEDKDTLTLFEKNKYTWYHFQFIFLPGRIRLCIQAR